MCKVYMAILSQVFRRVYSPDKCILKDPIIATMLYLYDMIRYVSIVVFTFLLFAMSKVSMSI